jgi:hypothetical protein
MAIAIDEKLANRLQTEQTIWLTTVRPDGTPVPTPVWFYWHELPTSYSNENGFMLVSMSKVSTPSACLSRLMTK